jgi:hypothetical protein
VEAEDLKHLWQIATRRRTLLVVKRTMLLTLVGAALPVLGHSQETNRPVPRSLAGIQLLTMRQALPPNTLCERAEGDEEDARTCVAVIERRLGGVLYVRAETIRDTVFAVNESGSRPPRFGGA